MIGSLRTTDDQADIQGVLGFRALAALGILIYHTWLFAPPDRPPQLIEPIHTLVSYGRAGTAAFIVLSAFLLYLPFARSILTGRPLPSVGRFLRRRLLRIVPAYWLILVVVALGLGVALVRVNGELLVGSLGDRPDLLLVNMLLLQNYTPETFLTGIGAAWFVSTIAVFYLSLPLLARVASGVASRSKSFRAKVFAALAPALLLFLVGVTTKLAALYVLAPMMGLPAGWEADWGPNWNSVLVRSFLGQSDRFSYGMVAAVVWVILISGRLQLPTRWWLLPAGALILIGSASVGLHMAHVINDLALDSGLALTMALLLFLVSAQARLPRRGRAALAVLKSRPLAAVGLLSYSVFLWHEPVIHWLAQRGMTYDGQLGFVLNLLLVGGITIALSFATYRIAERPFTSSARRRRRGPWPEPAREPGEGREDQFTTTELQPKPTRRG